MRRAYAFLLLTAQCAASYAALGGAPSTFSNGTATAALKARSLAAAGSSASTTYNVSESTLDSGTVVREYATTAGVVFAVSWDGPFMPDLRTLLGASFTTLTSESAKVRKAGRSQLRVNHADLVIESGGHMRAYVGRAWIPSALPAGFTSANIE